MTKGQEKKTRNEYYKLQLEFHLQYVKTNPVHRLGNLVRNYVKVYSHIFDDLGESLHDTNTANMRFKIMSHKTSS